jgi:hypothetical protein
MPNVLKFLCAEYVDGDMIGSISTPGKVTPMYLKKLVPYMTPTEVSGSCSAMRMHLNIIF